MMKTYTITYRKGLQPSVEVQAESLEMAKREAVANYRKTAGAVNVLSFFDADFLVEDVQEKIS